MRRPSPRAVAWATLAALTTVVVALDWEEGVAEVPNARIVSANAPAVPDVTPEHSVALIDPRSGQWHLLSPEGIPTGTFYYGAPGDTPIMGDWDCDGVDGPGAYRQSDGYVYLRNTSTTGPGQIRFTLGMAGDIPLAGDFNGDGCDTVSVYRPSEGRAYIADSLGANEGFFVADYAFYFGVPGDKPFAGDFDGDGIDTLGLHRESTGLVYFRNDNSFGVADADFFYGIPADRLIAGDWTGDGRDTVANYRPADERFYFRFTNTLGFADREWRFGESDWVPVSFAPIPDTQASFAPGGGDGDLTLDRGGDVDYELVSVGSPPEQAVRSGNGSGLPSADGNTVPDYYLQFQVNDTVIHNGSPTTRARIEIEYLDVGTDTFNLQYDALDIVPGDGTFTDTRSVVKTDSGEFRTAVFHLCDAYFGNRDNGADFRLSDGSDGAETIRRIAVILGTTVPSEIRVDEYGADPFDHLPDSDAIQDAVGHACDGDTVLFTSGIDTPGYVGYLVDKTIFLVHPEIRSDLTFRSTDASNHASLEATRDLLGRVVHLYARSRLGAAGLIDDIRLLHLNIDGNRAERVCTGEDELGNGVNDSWGSWLPECTEPDDTWCSPGSVYLNGGVDFSDPEQDHSGHPDMWSTGFTLRDLTIANTECASAVFFQGAEFTIEDVTIDVAGDHVHAPGCALTDPDEHYGSIADGITFLGPGHTLRSNLILDASDIGIVSFGGRDVTLADNTVRVRPGNHGTNAGIAMHPNQLGNIGGLEVVGNTVVNQGDQQCGGIHIGINLGVHTSWNGCVGNPVPAAYGTAEDCALDAPPPLGALCGDAGWCRTWGHIPAGEDVRLRNNTVTGAQVNYVISGLDVLGELVIEGNESHNPQLVDWEVDDHCELFPGIVDTWGALDYVAFNPTVPGWVNQRIVCP